MRIRWMSILVLLLAALAAAQVQFPNGKKEKEDPTIRTIQGVVKDTADAVVVGAVVQLKNTKTLQVRSFITKEDGKFNYNSMPRDVNFEIRAESKARRLMSGAGRAGSRSRSPHVAMQCSESMSLQTRSRSPGPRASPGHRGAPFSSTPAAVTGTRGAGIKCVPSTASRARCR